MSIPFQPNAFPRISVTELCRQQGLIHITGEVIRNTSKACLFRSPDLTARGVPSPCWIPLGAIDDIRVGEDKKTVLSVDGGFLARKRASARKDLP